MEPYTEIFDKRPLTYIGEDENQSPIVAWYNEAIYYTDRSEYAHPMSTGNLFSGSELIDVPERFAVTKESGVNWAATENTGSISIYSFTDTGQLFVQFDGTFPTLCWNHHIKAPNEDILCFYLGASGVEGRSSRDNFSTKFDVFVDSNLTSLHAAQELSDYQGRLGIFGKYQQVSGIILANLGN